MNTSPAGGYYAKHIIAGEPDPGDSNGCAQDHADALAAMPTLGTFNQAGRHANVVAMTAKHTPSPWRPNGYYLGDSISGYVESGERTICQVYGSDQKSRDANVHLIAAAPALLSALKEAAALIAEYQRNGCERGEVAVPSIILDALKLAEGGGN